MGAHAKYSKRLSIFAFLLVAIVFALGFRLVDFQVVRAEEIQQKSLDRREVTRTLTALRGNIVDSTGQVLAKTVFRYDINAAPKNVGPVRTNVDGVIVERSVMDIALELAPLLELDLDDLLQRLEGDSEYVNLAKLVDADTYNQIRDMSVPWIFMDRFADRLYPNGAVAGNLLGFVSSDGTPLAGLERQYNTCLAGVDGQETYERSAEGVKIPTSNITTQPIENGGTLNLSIDANLQFFAQQVLADTVSELNADWASAVVIEAETGRILAAAEAPTVDPNDPAGVPSDDRGSRIFQFSFEPGSIMKSITTGIVLDTGAADEYDTVPAPDRMYLEFNNEYIKDSFDHEDFTLSLAGVLRYSSNTGMTNFGKEIDREVRGDYLEKFGFGAPTTLRFEGESGGILRPAEQWDEMTNLTSLFGQGLAVTPIQMAYAYQALANGGVRLDPILVDSCTMEDGSVFYQPEQGKTRVLSEAAAKVNIESMEKVVEFGGVGKTAGIPGYRVAGKTGTAEISANGVYLDEYAISFYGVAPAEDPKFVVGVTIYRPEGVSNSSKATSPFKAIMQQALKHYRIPPSTTESRNIPSDRFGNVDEND
jgi:cell division protein FtsI (penicillin-binding protein 3)